MMPLCLEALFVNGRRIYFFLLFFLPILLMRQLHLLFYSIHDGNDFQLVPPVFFPKYGLRPVFFSRRNPQSLPLSMYACEMTTFFSFFFSPFLSLWLAVPWKFSNNLISSAYFRVTFIHSIIFHFIINYLKFTLFTQGITKHLSMSWYWYRWYTYFWPIRFPS